MEVLDEENPSRSTMREILCSLARMDHPSTHESRRRFVESYLTSSSLQLRDAALVAIDLMGDPQSAPALTEAIARESNAELRADMQAVANDLS